MGWTGGKDGKSWKVGGVDEKSKEEKKEYKRLEFMLSKLLRPGDGQIGVYFEHPDPKVDNSLNLCVDGIDIEWEIAAQVTYFSLINQMNQQLDSRADYCGSPLPRVTIAHITHGTESVAVLILG